jgi:putative ABC transport system permease protein
MKNRKNWFLVFFMKSISQRKGRVLIASVSVALAVAIITCMAGLVAGISEKLGAELKSYGANIIVSGKKGEYLHSVSADKVSVLENVEEVAGQILGGAVIEGQSIEVIGLDIDSIRKTGWRIKGKWPESSSEILAGVNLRDALKIEEGKELTVSAEGRKFEYTASGFLEKGGPEDSAILMSISDAWGLLGIDNKLSVLMVRGRPGELETVVKDIEKVLPQASVKTLRQVAFAEESLLSKMQLLMALVTIVVFFATTVCVASTMGANVLERREEIGLMKAIGATKKEIGSFYYFEALVIGFIGGITGYVMGYGAAQLVSQGAFGSLISIPLYIAFFSIVIGSAVAVTASYFPVRNALKYSPAVILRGE